MLRIALLILLLANAGYFLWSQGLLAGMGLGPDPHGEPERLQQQLQPEALRLLTVPEPAQPTPVPPAKEPGSASPSVAPAPLPTAEPTACLEAGPYEEDPADTLRRALLNLRLPEGSWQLAPANVAGRWLVYMGKFPDLQSLEKKSAELSRRNVAHERAGGALQPGLSLGHFSSEEAATRELTQLARQGVRSARVVQERPEKRMAVLRLPTATPALRSQIAALPALGGKNFVPCSP